MTSQCTWVECTAIGTKPQIARDGEQWANLCSEHEKELEKETDPIHTTPQRMMSAWIKAQGGAVKAARRMVR